MRGEIRYLPKPLDPRELDRAYPLVRELAENLTIEKWRAYAEQLVAPRGKGDPGCGIIVLEGERNYLRGLFAYRVAPTLRRGRTMHIDYFAVPAAVDRHKTAIRLIKAAKHCASRNGCETIRAKLHHGNRWLAEVLRDTGYMEDDSQVFELVDVASKART